MKKDEKAGNGAAILALGNVHHDGKYLPADREEALKHFLRAGQLGMADGWYRAGLCYEAKYDEWVQGVRNDVVLKGKEGHVDFFATLEKIDIERPHNPLARQAALCFMRAARMGHERAAVRLLPRDPFADPGLIKWAERTLDPKGRAEALDFNEVPEWIRNAGRELKDRKERSQKELERRLIEDEKKAP